MLGYEKISIKESHLGGGVQGKTSVKSSKPNNFKSNFLLYFYIEHINTVFYKTVGIQIAIIYEKMNCMDEEQFEQLTLSDFKIWDSTALKTFLKANVN